MTPATAATGSPSVAQALRRAERRLAAAGCGSPRLDAELLMAHALGTTRERLLLDGRRTPTPRELCGFDALLLRREAKEPVAYLLGRRGFRHIELEVDRRVLIPRPETELLVEAAHELPRGARVADVGTGSGAVALALKHERPDLRVVATDLSPDALALAAANARRLRLEVELARSDLLSGVQGHIDAVVANLPYVADRDWEALPPDVAAHEPRLALAGGPDGLVLIGRLVVQAAHLPWLALEVGAGQAGTVQQLLVSAGMATQVLRDLAGIDRVVVGRRP